jgi:hypothetical protein
LAPITSLRLIGIRAFAAIPPASLTVVSITVTSILCLGCHSGDRGYAEYKSERQNCAASLFSKIFHLLVILPFPAEALATGVPPLCPDEKCLFESTYVEVVSAALPFRLENARSRPFQGIRLAQLTSRLRKVLRVAGGQSALKTSGSEGITFAPGKR